MRYKKIDPIIPDSQLGELFSLCGKALMNLGDFSNARDFLLPLERSGKLNSIQLAAVQSDLGIAYGKCKDADQALYWHKQVMQTIISQLPEHSLN